ncbi:hypothetical protein L1887_19727 [Cichorium endivia]|nr:hypothetical protein L1887_19727 [Cichorium endivia]
MFEAHVLHLLRKYLGEYVHGLSSEALRISVWKGDVVLKDLKLKAEALNSLKLPVTVKAGFVGQITLKVPWKGLGKEPVIVLIDRVFVLAHPASDGRSLTAEEREKIFESKLQQIEEAETATLDAISKSKVGNGAAAGNSWLGSLIGTIIGNLKISIGNVHIRYEDSISNPGHPFAVGITLAKLAAFTVDEKGNETFDTSGALDKLRKSLQLERLAMYHDFNRPPWKIDKKWEDLNPKDWVEIFEDGINEPAKGHTVSAWARDRHYLVSPINALLKYHRLGNDERTDPEMPFEEVHLILGDVSLTVTEAQYHDWIRLLEVISKYKSYIEVSHLRPVVSVRENPKLWWHYFSQAALQQKKMSYRLSWSQIQHFCRLRRRYIKLYACILQQLSDNDDSEARSIERDLDPKVILLWRFLAHAKVESVKSKEEGMKKKDGWFSSFGWKNEDEDGSDGSQTSQEGLSKDEWQTINNLLSFQPDEDVATQSGKDMPNMTQRLVLVTIGQAAARVINIKEIEMVCGRFEQLQVSAKFKHKSIYCDLTLKYYGLSAPEGSLCQSVCNKQKANALGASFVYLPAGENLEWKASATISPCHVTVLMDSINRVLEFMKRSSSVSPTVAFETATALQDKLEKATRRAQEQFKTVIEEQSRFALFVDLDAPKIRVPIRTSASSEYNSHFLLDFGHFTLRTEEDQPDAEGQMLYTRFSVTGRDIAAFFTDGRSEILESLNNTSQLSAYPVVDGACVSYSLVDRCGILVIAEKIKVPHPLHPSTRVSVQVPTLGIRFSPSRFARIMELLKVLSGTIESGTKLVEEYQAEHSPWSSPDIANDVQTLVWRGIGYSVASWQPSHLVLSGLYLYQLESQTSTNYQRCTSMAGKQVLEVPPNSVGGSSSCIAVYNRGMDIQKALESSSTLVVKFQNDQEKASWFRALVQATYRASATASVDILEKQGDSVEDSVAESPKPTESKSTETKVADLILHGALLETKITIYGKMETEVPDEFVETPFLEVLAAGGKLYVASCEGDLTVRMNLHMLKVKDELQNSSTGPHYLALSVVENYRPCPTNPPVEEIPVGGGMVDDDDDDDDDFGDDFADADEDFTEPVVHEKGLGDVFFEAEGVDDSDFVSLTFLKRTPQSSDYNGIDSQASISMSRFEFFCHRPTIVALISLGIDMGTASSGTSGPPPAPAPAPPKEEDETSAQKEKADENEQAKVKGLLGHGKSRTVFSMTMNIDSVIVYLNKEDGSQLAMLVQESFMLGLKLHPGSISVEGTLGNFRLCDCSLGPDHVWGWIFDIRNQGADSLIQFAFESYNPEDDDYTGYNFSLSGKLSSIRIVFLNRFIQELLTYVLALVPPNSEEAIKFVDKAGGFEWLIKKYEMDGGAAIKLDLSLETPIIVVPRNSHNKDFLEIDLGHLKVTNEASWHGPAEDPNSVHRDIMHAQIFGINMAVGVNGVVGKPMMREGREIHIFIWRSLRDIFRRVPNLSLEVKIGSLHTVLSDKEYGVITSCLTSNMGEQPNLPPPFRDIVTDNTEAIRLLADKVNMTSQVFLSRSVNVMAIQLDYVLLELRNGNQEDTPLANITLEGLWLSHRMTSFSEMDLYITLPRFSILDTRPETRPEMRLMLGTSTDVLKQASSKGGFVRCETMSNSTDVPHSTMVLMDLRLRSSSQLLVVRIQLPRVLVVPDFLLAVGEFFVPSLGALTGKEEVMDPKNDPISKNNTIVLSGTMYQQTEDEVHLSPSRQLVVDAAGVDEYTYDGCGNTIVLNQDDDQSQSSEFRPIIIIGRGKKLRFVNVKIKNGSLLTDCTYLSNDSSFSVSAEDGVEIAVQDIVPSVSEKKTSVKAEKLVNAATTSDTNQTETTKPSISFEAQVVSPEFTFYDSSKSSIDSSFQAEKLLRVRMDLSFMFASKENDTWIRALLKDLTIETGSGLRILDPVDISAGFTSVKDKTNISLISTDIYVHLSLSAISLILNLQNQALSALRFQSADPLSPCTNFDRVWVSPKAKGHNNTITFWRPRAPSNYVILGDCVTSRPIPPSQAVMAVSNAYGRVRRPLGFKLIGLFSSIQHPEKPEDLPSLDSDCSLWAPVPPPGYLAVGCIVHIGNQPPPTNVVYCIRADLATSSAYSACMFNSPPNNTYTSGFSVWRLDNFLGSFDANPSVSSPSSDRCYDINHLLLFNSSWNRLSARDPKSDVNADQESNSSSNTTTTTTTTTTQQQTNNKDTTASGCSKASCCMSTPSFERIWWDKGGDARKPVSVWRPIPRPGFKILGDCITEGLEPPGMGLIFKADNPDLCANPVQFTKVANVVIRGVDDAFFWYPVAPPGYASMGCIVTRVDKMPKLNMLCCPRNDLVTQANIHETPISKYSTAKGNQSWSIWKVNNQAHTFLARADLKPPSTRLAFTIGDSVKPKARDNIMAEIKLKCFSLTILDSLGGMMTPFFDFTITNIKLATHGGMDSMNAVLISSISASTFNTQLDSWEPIVEPFDGIFKFETYDTNEHVGKKARIAATSALNINVSSANIDTFAESIISWRRLRELEQKALKAEEETSSHSIGEDPSVFSALDVEDFQTVTIENRLGCDIYLKKYEDESSNTVTVLRMNDTAPVWIPPSRYSDRLNSVEDTREGRCYVAVQIVEAKDLPTVDDGNNNTFFCALRLVVDSQEGSQQRLFPQSARTRCVQPLISIANDLGNATWDELFIFEVPRKGMARLEVEVTNLGAKAGKGEVVGASTISVGHGANPLKKLASTRMLQQATGGQKAATHLLMRRGPHKDNELPFQGCLVASTSYFEMNAGSNPQNSMEEKDADNDVGFWVGPSPEGSWLGFRSFLPLSVIARKLDNDYIAMEVIMKDGKKRATLRGLATVANDSNLKLDINVCSVSKSHDPDQASELVEGNTAIEEIFENQRHSSILGWGNKRSFRGNEPGRWSNRNLSYSTNTFYEPPLPPGWAWMSAWAIDKSDSVDVDGWAYGRDYQTLKWPPTPQNASRTNQDNVRRRRWIRTRQKDGGHQTSNSGSAIRVLQPNCSLVLPWKAMSKDSDSCLQIRPSADHVQGLYTWGCPAGSVSSTSKEKEKEKEKDHSGSDSRESLLKQGKKGQSASMKLNQLEKNDTLWCCPTSEGKQFWLSVSADALVLQSDLNAPVYDWKITVSAPLKLENRLSCPAQFTIWEKLGSGNMAERQRGLLESRGVVPIYYADVRNPLFLTLSVQGGWTLEKDHVPLLDISTNTHASSFWMVHQNKKRRLRVSIECDMGASPASPSTIRFFVPYWISNDCSVPLTYQVVEIDPSENADADPLPAAKPARSGKFSFRAFSLSDSKSTGSRKNIQVLEAIEDTSPTPSMFSPQDYVGQGGNSLFSSRNDAYLSPRVGVAVATQNSDVFTTGLSLLELEKKQRVDVKAFNTDGSYYKLSILLQMTSDRTKVVRYQPHTLFLNRAGLSICLQQCDTQSLTWVHPIDAPNLFKWQSSGKVDLLKLKVDGYQWSAPFSVANEGSMRVSLKSETTGKYLYLKVEIRSGTTSSRFDVIFRPNSFSSPYRIENRSMFVPFHFRQTEGGDDSWRSLPPCSTSSFSWEDLGRQKILELRMDNDTKEPAKYNIDEIRDFQPVQVEAGPTKAVRVSIMKEEKMNVVMIRDWVPDKDNPEEDTSKAIVVASSSQATSKDTTSKDLQPEVATSDSEVHLTLELIELGLSIIDHTPEEILYLSVQNLVLSHASGLGSGISRMKLRMRGIQVDNQLPLTPMPVLFRPQKVGADVDYIFKFSMTQQSDGSVDFAAYPYIGLQGPENSAFLISVHEPIIWRLHGMVQQIDFSRFGDNSQTTAVKVDPIVDIGVLNISEFRFKFSMAMSPTQRPVGVLGFWASLMTALGNTENMPIRVNQRFLENLSLRQSVLITNAVSNITKDILSQPLQLLSGVDILGNASSAFGHMSKGVAALSMDKKFIQSRQRQENKGVEDFSDVIREGGGALAKGLFRGVTGILTKPLEGAKASGVEGFVSGVGKGIIGAAAQPVSGVLDLLSKTTEGANAMRMKIAAAITSEDLLLRRRLPRVISGDNLLRPYDEYRAQGQVILQLAESGSFFLQVDLFKVRGKFALSDAYEGHFSLRKEKILLVTHRRVMLLQTSNIISQKKFNPVKDPCLVLWDVLWEDLATMELTTGKKDHGNAPPSKLILYLKSKTSENSDRRTIKCYRETKQATEVYSSIELAMRTYAPKGPLQETHKRKVKRPYAATTDVSTAEAVFLKERPWTSPQLPAPLPPNSTFGRSDSNS